MEGPNKPISLCASTSSVTHTYSVILVWWYVHPNDPLLKFFEKPGQNLPDQFYVGQLKRGLQNVANSIVILTPSVEYYNPGCSLHFKHYIFSSNRTRKK